MECFSLAAARTLSPPPAALRCANVTFANATTVNINGVYDIPGTTTGSDNTNAVTFGAASTVTSIGTALTLGNAGIYTFNSDEAIAVNSLSLAGAILTGSDAINVSPGGTFAWTAGSLAGSGITTLGAGSTTTISTAATKTLNRSVANSGTVNWNQGSISGTVAFTNQGGAIFNVNSATAVSFSPPFTNQASGSLIREAQPESTPPSVGPSITRASSKPISAIWI